MNLLDRFTPQPPAKPPQGSELMLLNSQRGFFGEKSLLLLIAGVTLLLQSISFITTLQGATLFLSGLFFLAPLFFALAVQATAWFLAGSLRVRVTFLRSVALGLALCCSTYYSYVGIYNNVNPPAVYLAADYAQVRTRLEGNAATLASTAWRTAQDQVNGMITGLGKQYTLLSEAEARLAACQTELDGAGSTYAGKLKAPSQSAYSSYEAYLKAYQAYLASVTSSTGSEATAARSQVLERYGFATEADLAAAKAENAATLTAFNASIAALGAEGEGAPAQLETARSALLAALATAQSTGELSEGSRAMLAGLTQAAATYTGSELTSASLLAPLDELMGQTGSGMASFESLAAKLPGGQVTKANAQEMKILMSDEILNATLRLNALRPESEALDPASPELSITDLHLKPFYALADESTQGMALFCLGLAALMDGLTLLFSLTCRRRRSLLYSRTPVRALLENGQVLAAQICASLPASEDPMGQLEQFLARFAASPATLAQNYSLAAARQDLPEYERLIALLCQLKLACIRRENDQELVLLKNNFLLFANDLRSGRLRTDLEFALEQTSRAQLDPAFQLG